MRASILNFLAVIKKLNKVYSSSALCLLLAVAVAICGSVSYSRYVSGDEFLNTPGAGNFSSTAQVTDVSALTFTNMAFWGGLEDIGVSMNSLRTVSIDVNNFDDKGGTKKVTEVNTAYSLIFETPENFAGKLAMQLIDDEDNVLTSQIVLADIINSVTPSAPLAVFRTGEPLYNGKKYVGTTVGGDIVSYMTFDVALDTESGVYTAASRDTDGTVITIEPFIKEDMNQTLYFRLWDVEEKGEENVELESGTLKPPLVLTFTEDVACYRVTVSRPDFKLPAGVETTDSYSLTLAPIDALMDAHLGGYLMELDSNGNMVYAKTLQAGKDVYLSTVMEVSSTDDGSDDKMTLMGNIPTYIVGKTEVVDLGDTYRETTYTNAYTETVSSETEECSGGEYIGYYTYTRNRWRKTTSSSSATYKIENWLKTTRTTTTVYEVRVREITTTSEAVTTTSVSNDKTLVEQDVVKTGTTTKVLLDALKMVTTSVRYTENYKYFTKSNGSWVEGSEFNNFTAAYPTSYEIENPSDAVEYNVPLTEDEITELKTKEPIRALLQESSTSKEYKRTITYQANFELITPTSLSTSDDSISLDPLRTHITTSDGVIQKYYVSTSYSKNYPFYVKLYFEQIQD